MTDQEKEKTPEELEQQKLKLQNDQTEFNASMKELKKQKELILERKDELEKRTKSFYLENEEHIKSLELKKENFDLENVELTDAIKKSNEMVDRLTESSKTKALEIFEVTTERKFGFGVEIKNYAKYNYDDKDALEWCKKHDLALQIIKPEFKKLIKAVPASMDFLKSEIEQRAIIPTKILDE